MKVSGLRVMVFALFPVLLPIPAEAARLGGITVISALGEPFSAEIALDAKKEELSTLTARIAPSEDYAEQGIDYSASLSTIHVEIAQRPDNTPVIRLSSKLPHRAPYLDLLVQVEWASGRLMREYTTVPNTPVFVQQPTPTKAPEPINVAPPPVKQEIAVEAEKPAPVAEVEKPAPAVEPPPSSQEVTVAKESLPEPVAAPTPPAEQEQQVVQEDVHDQKVAEEPKQDEQTATAPEQEPDSQNYVTKNGDTLLGLTRKLKLDGVSSKQMLQAIYEANKDAFIRGDMNRLKLGKKLRVPTSEEIQSMTQPDEKRESPTQAEEWEAERIKLAMQAQESTASEDHQAPNPTKEKTVENRQTSPTTPTPKHRDVVKLSSSFKEGHAGNDKSKQLSALADDAVAREQEIKQAEEKSKLLEQQVKNMQKLLEIKNQMLADKTKSEKSKDVSQENTPPSRLALMSAMAGILSLIIATWFYFRLKRRSNPAKAP